MQEAIERDGEAIRLSRKVGVLQAVILGLPVSGVPAVGLLARLPYSLPPIGLNTASVYLILLAGIGMTSLLALRLETGRLGLWLDRAVLGFVLFGFCYIILSLLYVVPVEVPSLDKIIYNSVGFERSAFANAHLADMSDMEMLIARGPSEEEVEKLYTQRSLIAVRSSLILSYVAGLGCLNFAIGCLARWRYEAPTPSKTG